MGSLTKALTRYGIDGLSNKEVRHLAEAFTWPHPSEQLKLSYYLTESQQIHLRTQLHVDESVKAEIVLPSTIKDDDTDEETVQQNHKSFKKMLKETSENSTQRRDERKRAQAYRNYIENQPKEFVLLAARRYDRCLEIEAAITAAFKDYDPKTRVNLWHSVDKTYRRHYDPQMKQARIPYVELWQSIDMRTMGLVGQKGHFTAMDFLESFKKQGVPVNHWYVMMLRATYRAMQYWYGDAETLLASDTPPRPSLITGVDIYDKQTSVIVMKKFNRANQELADKTEYWMDDII